MSNISIYRFALDMTPGGVTPVVHLSQYDDAFQLEFTLYSRTGELDIPSGTTAMIEGTKLDGKAYSANAAISGNVVTVTGDVQISAVAGNNPFQIVLKSGNSTIGSANFTISVERAALDYDTVSDSKLAQIQDISGTAAQLTAAAENVTDGVETFEALAESVSDMLADITDDTLSITDKAADAAAVGNALAAEIAPKYSTSATYAVGDYALYNNSLYRCITAITTAESWTAAHWTAVKIGSELGNLKSALSMITGVDEITGWIDGEYIVTGKTVGETVDISNPQTSYWYQYVIVPCSTNDNLIISGTGGGLARLWCFLDGENRVLLASAQSITEDALLLIPPKNTAKVVINRGITTVPCYVGKTPKSTSDAVDNFLNYYTGVHDSYIANLLDKDKCEDGGYYDYSNTWIPYENYYATGLIPCKAGKTYSINYQQNILLYDINKNFIKYTTTYATKTGRAFIVPYLEKPIFYFRCYGLSEQKETDAIYNGEVYIGDSRSMPFGNVYPVNAKLKNKIIYTFGDSRTWFDLQGFFDTSTNPDELCIGYQTWMRRFLTTAVYNFGVSGYDTQQINTKVCNTDISKADIITVAGGVNDFLRSKPIGGLAGIGETFDTNTVYGALQSMVEYILTTKPDVKLMLINPFTGWLNHDTDEFPETYAEIKRNVATLYKLPLLDLTKVCGFNPLNRAAFYSDDTTKVSYRLHLNNKGNEIIGQMISSFVSDGF